MKCPACLTFGMTSEAEVQVAGTLYCAQHGVEALVSSREPARGPARRPTVFTPPAPPADA